MGYRPPFGKKNAIAQGILTDENFYARLSEEFNYVDKKVAREFWSAVVRTVSKELKDKGLCRLPHLGDFALVVEKPKFLLHGKTRLKTEGKPILKFYAKEDWRDYFNFKRGRTLL